MSTISTIHDTLLSTLSSVLPPTYRQLPNPYEIEDNNELFLTQGYGVAIGAGSRTDRLINCSASWERNFNIILVNQVTTTDHDITAKQTIAKNLLEDHYAVFINLENNASLSSLTINSQVDSDSGIQFVGDLNRYYFVEISVTCEYLESLS